MFFTKGRNFNRANLCIFLSNSPVTVLTGIFPRLIEIFLVSPLFGLSIQRKFLLPRTFETTSASFIPFVAVPSTFSIISPSLIPAFSAGESATGPLLQLVRHLSLS